MLGSDISYVVQKHSDSTKKFSETDIINMLEFFINNIFAVWWTCFSSCAPLLPDLFLYSHEADFIQGLLKNK